MWFYLYVFNKYNFCNFLIPFNYGSRKISNFEKWVGLSRSLATPAIIWVQSLKLYCSKRGVLKSCFRKRYIFRLGSAYMINFDWSQSDSNFYFEYFTVILKCIIYFNFCYAWVWLAVGYQNSIFHSQLREKYRKMHIFVSDILILSFKDKQNIMQPSTYRL